MKRYKLAILACSAAKLDRRAPARELYQGALFKASLRYAEQVADRVVILSARHGLVDADRELDPYDHALGDMQKHQRAQWGEDVARDLLRVLGVKQRSNQDECYEAGKGVLCLAPQSYVKNIGHCFALRYWERPLRGLGIGQQKAKLAALMQEATA